MNTRLQGIGMTSQRTRERLINRLQERGIRNQAVLCAMRNTPRHIFVDEALASRAYEDDALPIGHGQTISQPFIVARMTEALLLNTQMNRVLEVGTGSGYQTAILAQLVEQVFTVERIQALQLKARTRLRELRLTNVKFKHDDGSLGWQEFDPYDGIIVTAAAQDIPHELLEQLSVGGCMLIPCGKNVQVLRRICREADSSFVEEELSDVHFVPLLGGVR